MKKIKAFFYVFYKSITSLDYYKDIFDTPFIFSIKYLAVLALIATVITTSVNTITAVPSLNKWIYDKKGVVLNMYPEDLVFNVKDGAWDINKEQPFMVKLPEITDMPKGELPENLVVFNKTGTINDFENSNTLILINDKNALIQAEGKLEVYPLDGLPNGEFSKKEFTNIINKVDEIVKYLPAFLIIINMIALYLYYFVFRAIYLLVVTIILMIVNMIIKPSVEFANLYRIALHSMTIPLLIDMILKTLNISIIEVPWFLLLNVILGTMVIAKSAKIND